ncbi:MAG: lysylphosphatidylglycerol synthase domain-containing protein [Patescibacteria group bacterium]
MKRTYKILNYVVATAILAFLLNYLISNWQKISQHEFDLNVSYLVLSVFAYSLVLILLSLVWRKVIGTIDGEHKISKIVAAKIYMLSEFGKYMPGKVWTILGRIYLGNQSGISKKTLLVASSIDALLSPIATVLIGVLALFISLSISLDQGNSSLYILSVIVLIAGALLLHPRIMYPCFNFVLRKVGRAEIEKGSQLSYKQIARLFFFYTLIALGGGLCFVLFVASLSPTTISSLPALIAAFSLSRALGIAAPFAPSGLGVREGVMSVILGFGTFASISVFISFSARLWSTAAEVLALGITYLANLVFYRVTSVNIN